MPELDGTSSGETEELAANRVPAGAARPSSGLVVPAVRAGVRDPVVVILLLAALFDDLAGNGVHSILLVGAAVVLAWNSAHDEAIGMPREPSERTSIWPASARAIDRARAAVDRGPNPVLVGGALLGSLVVGGFSRYSWPATLVVATVAAVGIAVAMPGPLPGVRPPGELDPAGVVAWISVFVALGLWELTNLLLQPSLTTDSDAHPTISVLTDPVLGSHAGRSVGLVLWLALGWFLVRR